MADLRFPIPLAGDLADLVRKAVAANTARLREEIIRATDPYIKPNQDGTWPVQDRSVTRTLVWLRPVDDVTLAAMPGTGDGYRPGDLVFPADDTTTSTSTGPTMLWSDSFVVSTSTAMTNRVGDAYAGGANPSWVADLSRSTTTTGHVNLSAAAGLDMYSEVYARATAPSLTTTGTWRAKFTVTRLDANNSVMVVLRGSSYAAASTTRLKFLNTGGTLQVSVLTTGSTDITLGTAAFTAGTSTVTVESSTSTVAVAVDGKTVGTVAVPSTYPRLPEFVLWAPAYHTVVAKNFTMEVL